MVTFRFTFSFLEIVISLAVFVILVLYILQHGDRMGYFRDTCVRFVDFLSVLFNRLIGILNFLFSKIYAIITKIINKVVSFLPSRSSHTQPPIRERSNDSNYIAIIPSRLTHRAGKSELVSMKAKNQQAQTIICPSGSEEIIIARCVISNREKISEKSLGAKSNDDLNTGNIYKEAVSSENRDVDYEIVGSESRNTDDDRAQIIRRTEREEGRKHTRDSERGKSLKELEKERQCSLLGCYIDTKNSKEFERGKSSYEKGNDRSDRDSERRKNVSVKESDSSRDPKTVSERRCCNHSRDSYGYYSDVESGMSNSDSEWEEISIDLGRGNRVLLKVRDGNDSDSERDQGTTGKVRRAGKVKGWYSADFERDQGTTGKVKRGGKVKDGYSTDSERDKSIAGNVRGAGKVNDGYSSEFERDQGTTGKVRRAGKVKDVYSTDFEKDKSIAGNVRGAGKVNDGFSSDIGRGKDVPGTDPYGNNNVFQKGDRDVVSYDKVADEWIRESGRGTSNKEFEKNKSLESKENVYGSETRHRQTSGQEKKGGGRLNLRTEDPVTRSDRSDSESYSADMERRCGCRSALRCRSECNCGNRKEGLNVEAGGTVRCEKYIGKCSDCQVYKSDDEDNVKVAANRKITMDRKGTAHNRSEDQRELRFRDELIDNELLLEIKKSSEDNLNQERNLSGIRPGKSNTSPKIGESHTSQGRSIRSYGNDRLKDSSLLEKKESLKTLQSFRNSEYTDGRYLNRESSIPLNWNDVFYEKPTGKSIYMASPGGSHVAIYSTTVVGGYSKTASWTNLDEMVKTEDAVGIIDDQNLGRLLSRKRSIEYIDATRDEDRLLESNPRVDVNQRTIPLDQQRLKRQSDRRITKENIDNKKNGSILKTVRPAEESEQRESASPVSDETIPDRMSFILGSLGARIWSILGLNAPVQENENPERRVSGRTVSFNRGNDEFIIIKPLGDTISSTSVARVEDETDSLLRTSPIIPDDIAVKVAAYLAGLAYYDADLSNARIRLASVDTASDSSVHTSDEDSDIPSIECEFMENADESCKRRLPYSSRNHVSPHHYGHEPPKENPQGETIKHVTKQDKCQQSEHGTKPNECEHIRFSEDSKDRSSFKRNKNQDSGNRPLNKYNKSENTTFSEQYRNRTPSQYNKSPSISKNNKSQSTSKKYDKGEQIAKFNAICDKHLQK